LFSLKKYLKGYDFPPQECVFSRKKAGPTSRNFTLKGFISSASWPWLRVCERLGDGVLTCKILENHGEKTARMKEKLFKNWDAGQQQNRHLDFYHHHQKKYMVSYHSGNSDNQTWQWNL